MIYITTLNIYQSKKEMSTINLNETKDETIARLNDIISRQAKELKG
jgi:hypothetical protein